MGSLRILQVGPFDGGSALHLPAEPAPFARIAHANFLSDPPRGVYDSPTIIWSGTPSADLFERDPRAFAPSAWEQFLRNCDAIQERNAIWFRPHARHVLSDVQRIVRFIAERPGFGVALDPARLLESSMLDRAADHYRRAFETLGPIVQLIWLTGVAQPENEEDPPRPVPIGKGLINADQIVHLWRQCCPPTTPVVFVEESDTEQQARYFR